MTAINNHCFFELERRYNISLMRKVGLNGKSVMPMISGFACAVPAIMSARNIENKKERLLTILVTHQTY